MNNILIALFLGIIAGIIDIIPMIIQKLSRTATLSAFAHWVVLGVVIPYVSWGVDPWLKGLVLGELFAIPVVIMVSKDNKKSIYPIILMSALLGIGISVFGARFIG